MTYQMRKAVNLKRLAKWKAVLVSKINAFSEKITVILKIGLFVISLKLMCFL